MNKIQVEEISAIEAPGSGYVGWPTLAKRQSGELVAVYSGGRQHHVCPFGQVQYITSSDEGRSWTWPRTLVDGPLDDRDAGAQETSHGTLIVNWFTSLAWERVLEQPATFAQYCYPEAEQAEWQRRHKRLSDDVRQRELGAWCIRSEDGGHTWSQKIPTLVNSPHGPCELSDGRLLYVGKKVAENFADGDRGSPFCAVVGVAQSTDDGRSWQWVSEIAPLQGHESGAYHELHAVQASNGDIIAHTRNHNDLHLHETLQTESRDGGHTWSTPHPIGVWGFPAFLLRASDGRLITTVGHRREPNGNQIAISEDDGKSWGEPLPINTDSAGDFGYPSTVELAPGRFLTLWYDRKDREQTYLRLARWSLD
jgi:hypothetical protein